MKNGGGMTWTPVTYDPELEPDLRHDRQPAAGHRPQEPRRRQPVHRIDRRAQRRHRQDGVVLPVVAARHPRLGLDADGRSLIDGTIDGKPRKLIAQAARNGHFFLLDRTTGKAIVSTEFVKTNWSLGYDERGPADPEPRQDAADRRRAGVAESGWRDQLAVADVQPARPGSSTSTPSRAFSVYYIYDPSDDPAGWGGTDRGGCSRVDAAGDRLQDRQDPLEPSLEERRPDRPAQHGRQRRCSPADRAGWRRSTPRPATPLWHSRIGTITNAPITYAARRPAARRGGVGQQRVLVRDEQVGPQRGETRSA